MSAWTLSAPDFAAWDTTGFLFPPLSLKKKKKNCREQAPDSLPDGRRDRDTCVCVYTHTAYWTYILKRRGRGGEMEKRKSNQLRHRHIYMYVYQLMCVFCWASIVRFCSEIYDKIIISCKKKNKTACTYTHTYPFIYFFFYAINV